VKYSVNNVDSAAQTMDISSSYSVTLSPLDISNAPRSFSNPSPLPVVSLSDLALLNKGQTPEDMSGDQVTTGVSISVPAGSFTTDRITLADGVGTEWVDSRSGLTIQLSTTAGEELLLPQVGLSSPVQLTSTNIPTSNGPSVLTYAVVAIIIIAIIIGVIMFFRRRKKVQLTPTVESKVPKSETPIAKSQITKSAMNIASKLLSAIKKHIKTELRITGYIILSIGGILAIIGLVSYFYPQTQGGGTYFGYTLPSYQTFPYREGAIPYIVVGILLLIFGFAPLLILEHIKTKEKTKTKNGQ